MTDPSFSNFGTKGPFSIASQIPLSRDSRDGVSLSSQPLDLP